MAKLRIKNFGPITDGFDSIDGFIEFKSTQFLLETKKLEKVRLQKSFLYAAGLKRLFFVATMI